MVLITEIRLKSKARMWNILHLGQPLLTSRLPITVLKPWFRTSHSFQAALFYKVLNLFLNLLPINHSLASF